MDTTASANPDARNLYGRTVPGGRILLVGLSLLVPACGAALVALDARSTGTLDQQLLGTAIGFAVISCVVLFQAFRRLRGIAAVADAVMTADQPGVTPDELRVNASFGSCAQAWNLIAARISEIPGTNEPGTNNADSGSGVIDALADGVVVIDRDGTIISMNAAVAVLLDANAAQAHTLHDVRDGTFTDLVEGVFAGGPPQRRTYEFGSDDTPQYLRVRAARLGSSEDRVVLSISDITRQSVAEASRSGFLARATHELRAPLTNLKLYAEQAIEEGDEDPQLRQEALNVIGREVLRLERTVGHLLSVSELESGTARTVDSEILIDDMLHEVLASFQAAAESKQLALSLDAPPKLPQLRGDRDHIELVIQNLVSNAIKYTPEGGTVALRADCDEAGFSLDVVDSGIGIASDEAPLVFEKFYRAGDDRVHETEGSGLGLALAREIARQHGGDVTLDSELNRGSTFTLRLPIGRAA